MSVKHLNIVVDTKTFLFEKKKKNVLNNKIT